MMAEKHIMLVCAGGMSSSLLVVKMQSYAKQTEGHYNIFALSSQEAVSYIKKTSVDVVLLGPQIGYLLNDFKKKLKDLNIPVAVIPMLDYGRMNGENVIKLAEDLMLNS